MQDGLKISTRHLSFVAVVAFCIHIFSNNKADVDLWGNVGFVKAMPWSSAFHRTNTFSFTEPDHLWINHEWLAEYIFNAVYKCLGNTGLLAIKTLLGLCVVFLINLAMKSDCRSRAVRFLLLLLIISTMGYGFSIRPHHFTYLMYALFLLLLKQISAATHGVVRQSPAAQAREDSRTTPQTCAQKCAMSQRNDLKRYGYSMSVAFVVIPFLAVLWTNLHGAFFIGAILLAAVAILEAIAVLPRPKDGASWNNAMLTCAATALFLAGTFVNPYGIELWEFIFRSAATPRPYLSEWAPAVRLEHCYTHLDFVVLALIILISMLSGKFRARAAAREQRNRIAWVVVLLISFCAALLMRRNIPLFAITAGCLAAGYVEEAAEPSMSRLLDKINEKLLSCLLAAFILISGYYTATFDKSNPLEIELPVDRFPVDTVAFMAANNISGNALVFFDWAEYCIWKLYPRCKVFLDGRFSDAYGLKTIDDYLAFLYADGNWRVALTEYPTDIVLIHRGNPIYPKMLVEPGWNLVQESQIAGLFLKRNAHESFFDAQAKGLIALPPKTRRAYFP